MSEGENATKDRLNIKVAFNAAYYGPKSKSACICMHASCISDKF